MCTVSVTVDTNAGENRLFDELALRFADSTSVLLQRRRLDLGDVVVCAIDPDSKLISKELVIERKTWSDWSASICDGRYKEQKHRFMASVSQSDARDTQLVYVVEGTLVSWASDTKTGGVSNKSLNAAIIKTQLRDNIPVLRTTGVVDTADTVAYVAQCLGKGQLHFDSSNVSRNAGRVATKRKRSNLDDPKRLFVEMLSVVPGMSVKKSECVASAFPSMSSLMLASLTDIESISCGDGQKARKLGKALASRIMTLLKQ